MERLPLPCSTLLAGRRSAQPAPGVGSLRVIGSFVLGETASVASLPVLTNTIRLRFSGDGTVVVATGSLPTCSSNCVPQIVMARLPLHPDGSISAANGKTGRRGLKPEGAMASLARCWAACCLSLVA